MVYSDFEDYESDSCSISSLEETPLIGGARRAKAGRRTRGAGVISNLGIPVISNIAGLFGLGKGKKRKTKKEKEMEMEMSEKKTVKRRGRPRKMKMEEEMSEEEEDVKGGYGGFTGASYGRTRARAPTAGLLDIKHQRAVYRADQMPNMGIKKGGYVHRPAHYRGVGAGQYSSSAGAGSYAGGMGSRAVGAGKRRGVKGEGFLDFLKPITGIAKTVLPFVGGPVGKAASIGLQLAGLGRKGKATKSMTKTTKTTKTKKTDGRYQRAQIVKQVMAQRGVSLAEASKIVKNEGLY